MAQWARRQDGAPVGSGMLRTVDGVQELFNHPQLGKVLRQDGIDTMIFANQLEEMEAEIYRYDYPDVKTSEVIPLDFSGDPGAETNAWGSQDGSAEWSLLGDDGKPNDATSQAIKREKDSVLYESFAHAFGYSLNDIRRAAKAGIPLNNEQGILARESWEETFEDIVAKGYPGTQLRPLLNYPGVGSEDTSGTPWENITQADTLLAAVLDVFNRRFEDLKGIGGLIPNQWTLPLSTFMHLNTVPYVLPGGTIVTDKTVLDVATEKIRRLSPDFRFTWWSKCELAEPGGSRHRSILYRKDPRVLKAKSSVMFEMLPVQPTNYGFEVPCHARTAGVMITKPLGVYYVDIAPAT